jgi:hypothetical protein
MTSQATNLREGGLSSCCGRSHKLHAFTWKELDTVRAAQKLLGALTIGRGSARTGGGGGGSQRSQIRPFPALLGLEIAKNAIFHTKVLNKIYSRDVL